LQAAPTEIRTHKQSAAWEETDRRSYVCRLSCFSD
jgi:hypothetical protein